MQFATFVSQDYRIDQRNQQKKRRLTPKKTHSIPAESIKTSTKIVAKKEQTNGAAMHYAHLTARPNNTNKSL